MNILYDDNMPYAAEFFADLGDCRAFSAASLQPEDLIDTDILLVRSTLSVDKSLLSQAQRLSFVGTATAGTNHVDQNYLSAANIAFSSAAGCNAVAVAEYVLSAIFLLAQRHNWPLQNKRIGIVGAGHVGTALSKKLNALGLNYCLCDPPLVEAGDPREFVDLNEILTTDIICLHVPLVESGAYPSKHMFNRERLLALRQHQLLINACRGEVLDNQAALELFAQGHNCKLVLDVWENEPNIMLELLPHLQLATAHIAGHTLEGKARGTAILYQQLCDHLGIQATKSLSDFLPQATAISQAEQQSELSAQMQAALKVYDIQKDDTHFREQVSGADDFMHIRKHYAMRREYSSTPIFAGNSNQLKALYRLGFKPADGD